jgi:hypothetical protein
MDMDIKTIELKARCIYSDTMHHAGDFEGALKYLLQEIETARQSAAVDIALEIERRAEKLRTECDTPSLGIALAAVLMEGADVARTIGET